MRINFESGHFIQAIPLSDALGVQKKNLPVDFEILEVGLKNKEITLFGVSKNPGRVPLKEYRFLLQSSEVPLPKDNFHYYWYVGTISRKDIHIFEVV